MISNGDFPSSKGVSGVPIREAIAVVVSSSAATVVEVNNFQGDDVETKPLLHDFGCMHEAGTPEASLMNDTVGWGGVGSTKNWCDRHPIRVSRLAQLSSLLFRGFALLPYSEMQHES